MPSPRRDCATGLRRIDWVRLIDEGGGVRAEAVGVRYRLPVAAPIPVALATELIASGTPSVVVQRRGGGVPGAR